MRRLTKVLDSRKSEVSIAGEDKISGEVFNTMSGNEFGTTTKSGDGEIDLKRKNVFKEC